MKTREWSLTKEDTSFKTAFKSYCADKGIQIFSDGNIWIDAGGTITLYNWKLSSTESLNHSELLDKYNDLKNNAKLS